MSYLEHLILQKDGTSDFKYFITTRKFYKFTCFTYLNPILEDQYKYTHII